ncbi:hypothetical protein C479_02621 [Halovivax asiaticus JCM 14624]|uniref:Uncharacterized protein n=1 Tax=Halovivax asiaticus JCM 14624 TaxID=1227490 RepID=M0BTI3_9EURY|nr:hypothetical protein [Halovivax asiaticus]ELZ13703.1 hypothetical protein C479_02621 [Halovivax asiaticus JCM 14624]
MTSKNNPCVDRRTVIRTGVLAGTTAAFAGCLSSDDSNSGDEDGPDGGGGDATVEFEDDFEDGTLKTEPAWETTPVPGSPQEMSAQAVEKSSPEGGTTGVQLTDVTDDRYQSPSTLSLADPMAGMASQWTLSGLFTPVEIPEEVDERFVGVGFYWPFDGNFSNRDWVQFRFDWETAGNDTSRLQLRTQPSKNREWTSTTDATQSLERDRWYRWELAHDGDGGYVASRWPADGTQSDGTSVEATFTAPDAEVSFDLSVSTSLSPGGTNSAGKNPYTVHFDHIVRTNE